MGWKKRSLAEAMNTVLVYCGQMSTSCIMVWDVMFVICYVERVN
jgi:hypothetical protein